VPWDAILSHELRPCEPSVLERKLRHLPDEALRPTRVLPNKPVHNRPSPAIGRSRGSQPILPQERPRDRRSGLALANSCSRCSRRCASAVSLRAPTSAWPSFVPKSAKAATRADRSTGARANAWSRSLSGTRSSAAHAPKSSRNRRRAPCPAIAAQSGHACKRSFGETSFNWKWCERRHRRLLPPAAAALTATPPAQGAGGSPRSTAKPSHKPSLILSRSSLRETR
jgi:hypothetical protein